MNKIPLVVPAVLAILLLGSAPHASRSASATTPTAAEEQRALQELAALELEMAGLRRAHAQSSDVARQQAVAKWLAQRAARFEALSPVLAALADRQERKAAQTPVLPVPIPPDASPEKRQLLEELNGLNTALAQIRQQRGEKSREQMQRLLGQWMESHSDWLAAHLRLAKEVSAAEAANVEPGEIVIEIPAEASAEKRAFLHEGAAVLEEMAELQALYRDATDEQRQRAVAHWMETTAARLAAHAAEAKRLFVNGLTQN